MMTGGMGYSMSLLRNPEVKRSFLIFLGITVAAIVLGLILGTGYGLFAFCLCLLFDTVYLISTKKRYKNIEKLSREIDLVLHGKESIHLDEYAEGELSILQSEISKMTIRLKEQAGALRKDKTYLADSIADISHQIRTPLTSINIIVSLLQSPELELERRKTLIQELKKLLSRIDWLISTLLKMSRLEAGMTRFKKEKVLVSALIKKAVQPLAIPMELRGQELKTSIKGGAFYLGDLAWSVEAVSNILKNCLEHTPKGGIIEVEAEQNAVYTEIAISDSGSGIDDADLPHLFERFYKGKNSNSQSFGIGLALARMIVTEQNGTVKAENKPGAGAQFTIRFYKGII